MSSPKKPIRTPLILDLYEKYLDNQDSVAFVNRVSRRYAQGTLQRLALSGLREIRRAAVLAIGFLGDYESNHTLGRAMLDEDRTVRTLAENGLRSIWSRMGSEKERREIAIIARLNDAMQHKEVVRRATKLTEQSPWFAEAWHQRAIAFFALGRFADAIRDCHEALEINPYHFIAATCMGQAYLELENPVSALESFRRALRLNPDLEGVRVQVVKLARLVDER